MHERRENFDSHEYNNFRIGVDHRSANVFCQVVMSGFDGFFYPDKEHSHNVRVFDLNVVQLKPNLSFLYSVLSRLVFDLLLLSLFEMSLFLYSIRSCFRRHLEYRRLIIVTNISKMKTHNVCTAYNLLSQDIWCDNFRAFGRSPSHEQHNGFFFTIKSIPTCFILKCQTLSK